MQDSRQTHESEFLDQVVAMARRLAHSFDLREVLERIVDAGCAALHADRVSVLLFDAQRQELYSEATSAREEIRFPAGQGIAGETLTSRRLIRIDDCYSDPRFDPSIDRATGYHTCCMISLPLIGVDDAVVGVMQLLNAERGAFDEEDERLAEVLAVFAGLAVQRTEAYQDRLRKAKLEHDLDLAREIQTALLPEALPSCHGYELAVFSRPAEETGGDIYDLFAADGGAADSIMILLADAVGHGIAAAVSVTQLRAMLRIGSRLGAGLDELSAHLNAQLFQDLPSNRFVTTFLGLLDAESHAIDYRSLGQAPLLHYHAADRRCEWLSASGPPMGVMPSGRVARPEPIPLAPGDLFVLLSDGFYEYESPQQEQLGQERVGAVIDAHRGAAADEVLSELRAALLEHARGAPQLDDLTAIVVKRAG